MCMKHQIQTGIDTFSYYYCLSPKQKRAIKKELEALPKFIPVTADYEDDSYEYVSNYFAAQGVKLRIFRIKGSRWGLFVIVHPTLVLGNEDRSALYQATKTNYHKIVTTVDKMLEPVKVPCSVDDMLIYRVDVTANIIFDDMGLVEEYIRLLKKSVLIYPYKLDWFREKEKKSKDCKLANSHSHKQYCKSAAFFVYDKTAQLKMIDHFPKTLLGKKVLRLEAQLRRKALKKWVPNRKLGSNWDVLKDIYKSRKSILNWYLDRIQPAGRIIRYADATNIINSAKIKIKTRDRILYLLRKTSDSENMSAALSKMQEKYHLSQGQCNTILKKFRKLGISPITLRNNSNFDGLPVLKL